MFVRTFLSVFALRIYQSFDTVNSLVFFILLQILKVLLLHIWIESFFEEVSVHQASLRSLLKIQNLCHLRSFSLKGTSEFLCFLWNYPFHPICLSQRLIRYCNVSSFNSSKTKSTFDVWRWQFFITGKTRLDVHQSVDNWLDSLDQSFVFKTSCILDRKFQSYSLAHMNKL